MNKYKIEFKQIFNRLVTIYAEDEEQAMKVVEQTYLKTDLLDDNEKDLVGIEAKILEKNGEKVDRKEEIPENFENFFMSIELKTMPTIAATHTTKNKVHPTTLLSIKRHIGV